MSTPTVPGTNAVTETHIGTRADSKPVAAPTFADAMRGEVTRTRRRVAVWVSMGVWAFCVAVFAYLVTYLTTAGAEWYSQDQQRAIIDGLLPSGVAHYALTSLPLYGAPQFAILGAILGASDYARGTLATLLVRFRSRNRFAAAQLANLALVALVAALVTMGVSLVASVGIAWLDGAAITLPALNDLVAATAAAWLVAGTLLAFGFALGQLTRSTIGAVAIAVGWVLGVESLLIGLLAPVVAPLAAVQGYLPVGATASLVGAFAPADVPAAATLSAPGTAVLVLVAWLLLAGVVSWLLIGRRDIA